MSLNKIVFFFLTPAAACAEVHTMTLKQAADRALLESPDALVSRLDEQKAIQQVRVAKDPFVPKVYVGSGMAYTSGFPMSIEGSAPSIVQARAVASVYNRQEKFHLAQAREEVRGASLQGQSKREQAMAQTVQLFLDTERKAKLVEMARTHRDTARRLDEITKLRVSEGREIPLEGKRAALEVARAEQRIAGLGSDLDYAEGVLAMVIGLPAGDRVRPAMEQRGVVEVPANEEEAVRIATADNREIRQLESALLAKGLEAKAQRGARYPKFDLVAQYGLFAKFNKYEDFFRTFQRHNGQLGVSVQVPIVFGPAADALANQAHAEAERLRIQMNQTRSRITLETQKRFQDFKRAELARQVNHMDLDVAREALSVQLAKFEEGRISMKQIEESRLAEQEKWVAYYESQLALEQARFALLEKTGGLLASLR